MREGIVVLAALARLEALKILFKADAYGMIGAGYDCLFDGDAVRSSEIFSECSRDLHGEISRSCDQAQRGDLRTRFDLVGNQRSSAGRRR